MEAAAAAVDGGGHRTAPAPAPAQRSAAGPRRARARAAAVRESIWVGGEGGGGGRFLAVSVCFPAFTFGYLFTFGGGLEGRLFGRFEMRRKFLRRRAAQGRA